MFCKYNLRAVGYITAEGCSLPKGWVAPNRVKSVSGTGEKEPALEVQQLENSDTSDEGEYSDTDSEHDSEQDI